MARYLIVAHQTAESPELVEKVTAFARRNGPAEFVLLVPVTPVNHLLTWEEGESRAVAQRKAQASRAGLEAAGVSVLRTALGDSSPLLAIDDELRERPGDYDGIIICTFPFGVSRWLRIDLPKQAERKFHRPVIHVIARPHPNSKATFRLPKAS